MKRYLENMICSIEADNEIEALPNFIIETEIIKGNKYYLIPAEDYLSKNLICNTYCYIEPLNSSGFLFQS